ncbi:E3 SUMO-protein ligase ZBED1-like [Scomber scombrus]|uniref:E3 SUMO-protein ligase ZBED1-like n=1 Tax=Scomber scombrus TaxID=13677 RepID=UPI002DD92D14|nr:E3 SUMO-protein ligase ZBED1-like [Scomber scombrus]
MGKNNYTLLDGSFYFKLLPDGSVDKSKVVCSFCQTELKYHRSTSSLNYHLRAKHSNAAKKGHAKGQQKQSTAPLKNAHQHKPVEEDKLTTAIAKWVVINFRPVNIVEDAGLRDVLRVACCDESYVLPSRGTIVSRIHSLYETEKTTKLKLLQSANVVALTGDLWTSVSNQNYLGVSAHHIDTNWTLLSFALTVRQTEETRVQHFCDVAERWDIARKVTTIGADSALTLITAERIKSYQHMPCIAHSLQRSITAAVLHSGFEHVLTKCRKLVAHFKDSPANAAELKREQAQRDQDVEPLIQDVQTRWNSTLSMITRLQTNKDAVRVTLDLHKQINTPAFLTDAEFEKMGKLETLLEPCRYVTELLGGEQFVPCSVVLPALCHLSRLMEVSEDDPDYVCQFKEAFTSDLSKRKESINTQWLKVATALDPRFKDLKCLPRSEREEVWRLIKEESAKQSYVEAKVSEPPKKKMSLLVASDSEDEEEAAADTPVARYRAEPSISMETCPLKWWCAHAGAYPSLAPLAQKYLSTPATTVPCERLFSLSGHVVQKKRAALSTENATRLLCLSDWLREKKQEGKLTQQL